MISTIAVGTHGSGTATEAVKMAADLARRFGAKLVLVSAFQAKAEPVDRSEASVELHWVTSSSARVREILARSEADLQGEGIDCSTLVKGMRRRVLGSVPNTVTHNAACSVLVVKTS